jgi:hypothetical protein
MGQVHMAHTCTAFQERFREGGGGGFGLEASDVGRDIDGDDKHGGGWPDADTEESTASRRRDSLFSDSLASLVSVSVSSIVAFFFGSGQDHIVLGEGNGVIIIFLGGGSLSWDGWLIDAIVLAGVVAMVWGALIALKQA